LIQLNDNTGKGNTCDTENDEPGCIFTQKLIVLDATEAEIAAAVAGIAPTFTGTGVIKATDIALTGAAATAAAAAATDAAQCSASPAPAPASSCTTITTTMAANVASTTLQTMTSAPVSTAAAVGGSGAFANPPHI